MKFPKEKISLKKRKIYSCYFYSFQKKQKKQLSLFCMYKFKKFKFKRSEFCILLNIDIKEVNIISDLLNASFKKHLNVTKTNKVADLVT